MRSIRVTIELEEDLIAEVERLRVSLEMHSKGAVIERILRELLVEQSRKTVVNTPKNLKGVLNRIIKRMTAMLRRWKHNTWEQ